MHKGFSCFWPVTHRGCMTVLCTETERKPLVHFDTSQRAQLSVLDEAATLPMTAVTRRKAAAKKKKRAESKVKIVNGKIKLKVAGFPGVQSFTPSNLVVYVAPSKLKVAAKKVLVDLAKKEKKKGKKGSSNNKAKKKKKAKRQS